MCFVMQPFCGVFEEKLFFSKTKMISNIHAIFSNLSCSEVMSAKDANIVNMMPFLNAYQVTLAGCATVDAEVRDF